MKHPVTNKRIEFTTRIAQRLKDIARSSDPLLCRIENVPPVRFEAVLRHGNIAFFKSVGEKYCTLPITKSEVLEALKHV